MAEGENWITVNGTHILLKEGESSKEGAERFFREKRESNPRMTTDREAKELTKKVEKTLDKNPAPGYNRGMIEEDNRMTKRIEEMANHYADENVKALCRKALALSPRAQEQFVKTFNLDFAMDGQMYLGSSYKLYPELIAEAPAAGIEIIQR